MSSTAPIHEQPPLPGIAAPEAVKSILVCQLRQIGDVLLTTPAIELLAARYPDAQIHVLTEKKCFPMLEHNPHIHTIWPLDKQALRNPLKEVAYYRKIAATRFDLAVDFQQLPRCRAAMFWARATVRLSFPPPWYLSALYTHWHKPQQGYSAQQKAEVLAPLGISWNGEKPRLYLTEDERAKAMRTLEPGNFAHRPFISLDITHRHATRRWPARHYAALLDKLAEALPEWGFFLPYGPGEEQDVRTLAAACTHTERILIPEEVLSLRHMAACMQRASLHLGNCSAPRHMAVALDVPSFTILGSTSQGWTFPSAEHTHILARDHMPMPCQPCNKNACPNQFACLEKLTPDLVFPFVMEHLKKTR